MQWWLAALKNYVGFSGRARRTEYWMFTLFQAIIYIVLGILDQVSGYFYILYVLFALATLLPSLAVAVRRLHDTGKTGWLVLIGIIPIVGWIVLLVFFCQDGQPGPNQYGPNPKQLNSGPEPAWPGAPAA